MSDLCYHCGVSLLDDGKFYNFCKECGALQPSNVTNPFEIYGLELSFIIDEKQLEQQYFALQMQFHPDKFVTKSTKEKMIASQISMNINEAYQLLKDPILRADYLLVQNGLTSILDEKKQQVSPPVLMEQMEKREKLENAGDAETLANLFQQTKASCNRIIGYIQQAFDDHQWEEAQQQLLRLQYEQKLLKQIQIKQKERLT